jgi:hypothetical protein
MPARVNVYCKTSVASVRAVDLRRELETADLMILAEVLELPEGEEAAVAKLRAHLRVVAGDGTFERADVHWSPGRRSIQITREEDPEAELATLLDDLPDDHSPGAERVRAHIADTVEVVHIELGFDAAEGLGGIVTEVLAYYLAERGDGLVCFYHSDWAAPTDRTQLIWKSR